MVTDLATLIKTAVPEISDTGIEELITQIGLKFWAPQHYYDDIHDQAAADGIDEELLYDMGYTLGELPGNIKNSTNQFCNRIVGELLHSDTRTPFRELQDRANIYLAGYQAGLGV